MVYATAGEARGGGRHRFIWARARMGAGVAQSAMSCNPTRAAWRVATRPVAEERPSRIGASVGASRFSQRENVPPSYSHRSSSHVDGQTAPATWAPSHVDGDDSGQQVSSHAARRAQGDAGFGVGRQAEPKERMPLGEVMQAQAAPASRVARFS